MCNQACIEFAKSNLEPDEVRDKMVIEVGSLDVNGSVRPYIQSLSPRAYLGVDIEMGRGVDEVCDATDLDRRHGPDTFDLVVSTEMLEHVRDWRKVVHNLKYLVKPGGVIVLTTRSYGFGYHGYPYDFWRFELLDFREIFSDFIIDVLEKDPLDPGILLKARKPALFLEREPQNYPLYSMLRRRRAHCVTRLDILIFRAAHALRLFGVGTCISSLISRCAGRYSR